MVKPTKKFAFGRLLFKIIKDEGMHDHLDLTNALPDESPPTLTTPLSSLTSLSSLSFAESQTQNRKRRAKRYSKSARKKQRLTEKGPEDDPSIKPYVVRNHVRCAEAKQVGHSMERDAAVASSGWIGLKHEITEDDAAVSLQELLDLGFELIKWDGWCVVEHSHQRGS